MLRAVPLLIFAAAEAAAASQPATHTQTFSPIGQPEIFLPGIASTQHSEIRLTISPDGDTAMWFSRDRPGGAGGYDIWLSRRTKQGWSPAEPAPFNTPAREFDPAFTSDGRAIYFCSDRAGGMGGDDVYRVARTENGFGEPENLGPSVNSSGNEFAPMLSRDRRTLLFSSDRPGGSGGHDLYVARVWTSNFAHAQRVEGQLNSAADEFDATFLSDDSTILFARTPDLANGRVDLFVSRRGANGYEAGERVDAPVNHPSYNSYGPMIDWSNPHRLLFSARRSEAKGMDVYVIEYKLDRVLQKQ